MPVPLSLPAPRGRGMDALTGQRTFQRTRLWASRMTCTASAR